MSFCSEIIVTCIIVGRNISLAVVEGYSMGSRGGMVFSIGELGGIIKLLCYNKDFKTIIIPPKTLKKFVAGNGNAGKEKQKESYVKIRLPR